jgi:hypothetical protein
MNTKVLLSLATSIMLVGCMTGSPTGAYCLLCAVDIEYITADGGEIGTFSFSEEDREKARQLANANCQLRGFSMASLGARDLTRSWRGYYPFTCIPHQPIFQRDPQPPAKNIDSPLPSLDLDKAKTKCVDLGFKAGTQAFGNCVLKISK